MTTIAAIRSMKSRSSRSVLGMLAVLWFNMVLQPCAMASGADHDCPHCPPAHEAAMSAHHGHHGQDIAVNPCASMQSDCCDLGVSNFSSRGSELKIKDVFEQPALVADIAPWLDTISVDRPVSSTGPPPPLAASPPLHVLHCVYLK